MKSHFKPLGDYIKPITERNGELLDVPLMGLSIHKYFIPSIANTIGTDMSTYRLIKRNQFAYGPVTSRNGDKITVALFKDHDEALISQAYVPFEVTDENKLLPEYLMMWFSRPEFDRYARFKSHGSAREIFDWQELCETLVPVLSIKQQKGLVAEYKNIQDRIKLNQQLIQKLEETAQAIYKEWFVNNGDRVKIKDFGTIITGKTPSSKCPEDFGNEMPFVTPGDFKYYKKFTLGAERYLSQIGYSKLKNKVLSKGSVIVTCIGSDMGKIVVVSEDCITNQQMNSIAVKHSYYSDYLYYYLTEVADEIKGIAMGGSTMPMLSKSDFEKIEIPMPPVEILQQFESTLKPINDLTLNYAKEVKRLIEVRNLLLAKLASA